MVFLPVFVFMVAIVVVLYATGLVALTYAGLLLQLAAWVGGAMFVLLLEAFGRWQGDRAG